MKKIIITTMAAGLVAAVASAEVSVSMDFASAYVFRGVTLLDGASFQPGIEASGFGLPEECGAVSAGFWGSADLEGDNSSTFQEVDAYAAYSLPTLVDGLDVSVGYCEYAYGAGSSDKEASLGLGYDLAGVALSATYYQGIGGLIGTQMYGELGAGYDIEASDDLVVSLGARLGYLDPDAGKSGFSDYDLSIGASYALSETWSAGLSGTYIGEIDSDVLTTDVDFVGMFSLACDM